MSILNFTAARLGIGYVVNRTRRFMRGTGTHAAYFEVRNRISEKTTDIIYSNKI